jgi:hypothetical protein
MQPDTAHTTCCATLANGKKCVYRGRHSVGCSTYCGLHNSKGECPICFESMKPRTMVVLPCSHALHRDCTRTWFIKGSLTCPMCRADVPESVASTIAPQKMKPTAFTLAMDHDDAVSYLRDLFASPTSGADSPFFVGDGGSFDSVLTSVLYNVTRISYG